MKEIQFLSIKRTFIWFSLSLILFAACDNNYNAFPTPMYEEYIPLEIDKFILYEVDSIVYHNDYSVKYYFQIKELTSDIFINEEGRVTYKIERYVRNNDSDIWKIKDVWTANKTQTNYERFEENLRYIRLRFPIKENVSWDPNVYNSLSQTEFKYIKVHSQLDLGEYVFDSTVTVLEKNFSSRIENQYEKKVYAYNVGLIVSYKDSLQLDFTNGDTIGGNTCNMVIKDFN